jgi:hypothetical protein
MLETRLRRPTLSSNSRTGTRRKLAKLADTEFEEGRAGVLYKPPRVLGVSWQIARALTSN